MIKKTFLILCCLYLYISFVSHEDKTEWFSKGVKAYQTIVQKLSENNVHIEAQKWDEGESKTLFIEENKVIESKAIKKRRSF